MSYRRDFTIGLRETVDFYLLLALEKWRNGILGFGAAGALAVWMYTAALPPVPRWLLVLGGGLAVIFVGILFLVVSTSLRIRSQLRASGRESYVQETAIDGFGIHVTVEKKRAKLGFDKLARIRETGRAFYLFLSPGQAWILPKAQMEDRLEECRQLREIFRAVVERRRLKLRK